MVDRVATKASRSPGNRRVYVCNRIVSQREILPFRLSSFNFVINTFRYRFREIESISETRFPFFPESEREPRGEGKIFPVPVTLMEYKLFHWNFDRNWGWGEDSEELPKQASSSREKEGSVKKKEAASVFSFFFSFLFFFFLSLERLSNKVNSPLPPLGSETANGVWFK